MIITSSNPVQFDKYLLKDFDKRNVFNACVTFSLKFVDNIDIDCSLFLLSFSLLDQIQCRNNEPNAILFLELM